MTTLQCLVTGCIATLLQDKLHWDNSTAQEIGQTTVPQMPQNTEVIPLSELAYKIVRRVAPNSTYTPPTLRQLYVSCFIIASLLLVTGKVIT